jgi:hypothetical protein
MIKVPMSQRDAGDAATRFCGRPDTLEMPRLGRAGVDDESGLADQVGVRSRQR